MRLLSTNAATSEARRQNRDVRDIRNGDDVGNRWKWFVTLEAATAKAHVPPQRRLFAPRTLTSITLALRIVHCSVRDLAILPSTHRHQSLAAARVRFTGLDASLSRTLYDDD